MPLSGENAMNRLSKEKRNHLILAVLLTIMALSGLWFGLISFQKQSLETIAKNRDAAANKLRQMDLTIRNANQIEFDLTESSQKLCNLENGMASGDLYSWAINTLRQFKMAYKVDVPQFSAIDGPKDVSLLPSFPYKQASMTIGGTAYFSDFGRFMADFENQFPYARVLNLTLEPSPGLVPAEHERLSFKIDLAFLVKPSAS
jgi:hypothetical protein